MSFCCEICWEDFLSLIKDSPLFAHATEELSGDLHTQAFWRTYLDESSYLADHQDFYDSLIFACAQNEHKECMMKALDSINFFSESIALKSHAIRFILTDLELVNAAQQKLDFINHHYSHCELVTKNLLRSISVDVYRYITSHCKAETAFAEHIIRQGNLDVVKYVISAGEDLSGYDVESHAAFSCCWSEDGAACVEALCDAGLCDKDRLPACLNQRKSHAYLDGVLQKNLAELIEKNYICGSEICYKV
jgi:hypothetical protein